MSKYSATVTTNTANYLCDVDRRRDSPSFFASIVCYGTFGGGTITIQMSPDGGTTKMDVPNQAGASTTFTANSVQNIELGNGDGLTAMKLYATMAGSTSASVVVEVWDNR